MEREFKRQRTWTSLLSSAVCGAAAMYALDPDRGRRRRALARDKVKSVVTDTRDAVGVTRRDVAHRIQGLRARARRLFWQRTAPDDLRLIERVRARMGRLVAHPHAVQVGAYRGRVTLSGPVLAHEVPGLLESVRAVWGVSDVEDRLVVYDNPESVPSLQGSPGPRKLRSAMPERWSPTARAAAVAGGTLLALYATRRGTLGGPVLALIGLGFLLRGATNRSIDSLIDMATRPALDRDTEASDSEWEKPRVMPRRRGPSIYDVPSTIDRPSAPAVH